MSEIIRYLSPTVIVLPRDSEDVKNFLSYRDRSVEFQIFRLKNDARRGSRWAAEQVDKLKQEVKKIAGWYIDGNFCTYSGLARDLSLRFNWKIEPAPSEWFTEPKLLPWTKVPEFELWDHQKAALEASVGQDRSIPWSTHNGVSVPTGGGKSAVLLRIVKHYGLQTIVVAPSTSICEQLYNDFAKHFGIKYVGMYGGGKKKIGKLITICVAQGLARVEEGTEEFDFFSKAKVFLFDEAHQTPADTFERVAMKVAGNCPYRHHFSATHVRPDGSEVILKGITGPIVYETSFDKLVDKGVLAKPIWRMFVVPASTLSSSSDPNTETRQNLYKNPNVNKMAAELANQAVNLAGRPTVILIQEFSQFARLYPLIKVPFVFAHGGEPNKKDNEQLTEELSAIPQEYLKMDASDAIKDFNTGKVKLIIGTSAISTGVDLKPTQCLIYLQGGTSEIKVKQGIGRGTRMGVDGKKDCWFIDFLVNGSRTLTKHALKRKELYEELMGQVQIVGNYTHDE